MNFRLGYRPALDGLRAVFVLFVMASHAEIPFLQGGALGVDGFFVLSGFLITTILVRERSESGSINLRAFYARRALRLFPALFILLIVCTAFTLVVAGGEQADDNWRGIGLTLLYISNWTPVFFSEGNAGLGLLLHTWSLSVEEQFYLIWPLLLIALLSLRLAPRRLVALVALLAVGASVWRLLLHLNGAAYWRLYVGTDTRADSLLVGCTLGLLLSTGFVTTTPAVQRITRTLVLPALLLLFCVFTMVPHKSTTLYYGQYMAVAIAMGALILYVVVSPQGWLARGLSWKPLVKIGMISYGLYLWHYPVFLLIREGPDGWLNWQAQFAQVAITFMIAMASYRYVELPMLRLKERFSASGGTTTSSPHLERLGDTQQVANRGPSV